MLMDVWVGLTLWLGLALATWVVIVFNKWSEDDHGIYHLCNLQSVIWSLIAYVKHMEEMSAAGTNLRQAFTLTRFSLVQLSIWVIPIAVKTKETKIRGAVKNHLKKTNQKVIQRKLEWG